MLQVTGRVLTTRFRLTLRHGERRLLRGKRSTLHNTKFHQIGNSAGILRSFPGISLRLRAFA
ncbi:hypothetical protein PLANPX_1832 [Lacipirellula parvula]|uniref:Uncharacterized protein n=1 Tax=Lacipirellula parvula TaxID=2650471 RepID=A0A5K7X6L6_9BACT|nr:hypothetical protein PLANPX_1832 [Lacipirellula parvula]